jgi:hypothetical protein
LRYFEEGAQEPNVRFNSKSTTQNKGFSDFQLKEAYSSNPSTVAHSHLPTIFSHEPKSRTSATPTTPTVRICCLLFKNKVQVMTNL